MKNLNFIHSFRVKVPVSVAILLLFVSVSFTAKGQISANFISNQKAGCGPLVVQFTDSSKGNPSSWKWDMGNGTSSVLQNPSVAYFEPGTYTVKLIIKNAYGVDSVIKKNYITVYASPVINFNASSVTGCFPLNTTFTDLSSPGSGSVTNWQWDFGDGNLSDIKNPDHTYTTAGDFNVSLRVTNSNGCITSKTVPAYIHIPTGVKAEFTNSTSASCNAPVAIQFTDKSTGSGALKYEWNFGDGTTSGSANPAHTYSNRGSFTVSLKVTNSTGCTDVIQKNNLIIIGATKADFSIPAKLCAQTPATFINTSNPQPSSSAWNFGDGTNTVALNPVKVFKQPGTYTVTMISNNGACKDSISKSIQVIAKPQIGFSASDTISCAIPFNVNFINSSANAASYFWDFGDGTNSINANPSHVYSKEGNYTVKLFVTNASGCTDSLVKTDFIKIKIPVVTLDNLPGKGCAPLSHTFSATVNSVEPVIKYQWNFGDGSSSNAINPAHVYTNEGKYTVTLVYTTAGGCTGTVTVTDAISVGSKPQPKFIADPVNTCAFRQIHFTDQSSGSPDEWLWYFGDGGSSGSQNPAHQYSDTGLFDVTLISINKGCADTITYPKKVHIHPPVALFSFERTCSIPGKIIFTDHSIGADYWNWNFGDGTASSEKSPSHDFATPGTYAVSLTVTNQVTGCSETKIDTIKIIHEIPDFSISDTDVCKKMPVMFQSLNNVQNVSSYTWNFGDGFSVSDSGNAASHIYSKAASYNVTLILKDVNGCIDSATKSTSLKVNGPTAVFGASVAGICLNSTVNFYDSSLTDGTHNILKWNWSWGDGKVDNDSVAPFTHSYASAGNYTVSLVVTDSKGCTDTLAKSNAILVSKPVATFTADTLSCTGKPINFANSSSGPGLKYAWTFGDGTTSSQQDPVHLYSKEGVYSVNLAITDQYGCGSNISKTNYIQIANPKAGFTVSDSIGTCPPLVVTFTNQSVNYSKLEWNFGDGTTSAELNPSHFYSSAGTFNAVLTITAASGCTSQKTQKIIVKGPSGSFTYKNIIGCTPLQTSFTAQTQNNSLFIWDYNDGTTISSKDSNVVHEYTTPGKYLPKMILQDANGCKVPIMGKDSISVFGVTASFSHNGALVCDTNSVNFNNSSISNDVIIKYLWNFGDGSTSAATNPTHSYKQGGSYKISLVVVTKRGCTDTIANPQPVHVNRSPQISISGSAGECVANVFNFSGTVSNPDTSTVSWKWDFANGNTSLNQTPESQKYSNAGNYTIRAIGYSSNGCNDTATKSIEVFPLPELSIAGDTVVCLGASQTLKVSGAESYSWTPAKYLSCNNCATPVSRPDSAITYHVKGTSAKGCIAFDSIAVSVKFPFRLSFSKADTLCLGSSVQLHASGTDRYSWSPATGLNRTNVSSPVASPKSSTIYQVIGSDSKGCFRDTAYVPVRVYPIPVVNAGEDKTINVGQQIQISPTVSSDVTNITWTPSTAIVSRDNQSITVAPTQSIEYTIEASNAGGCRAQDRVSVFVLCNNANVFVPNTFSPNGDGMNDVFYPRGSGVFKILNLKVFNRWGQIVYDRSNINANDASQGWDGTYKGNVLSPDVFVYVLQVVCENNSILTFKGNIALLK
ncbi:MAG TPA: PKD domain-containing protein [Hanamia sp.]|nr:PKD domain-containing protein [Hanamia sp.]